MPEHSSWFNYLLPDFAGKLARFRELIGLSFINKAPVELQYVVGFAFIAIIVLILGIIARRRIVDIKSALIPDDHLTIRTFFEAMTEGALSLMQTIMDRKTAVYFLPLIGTCAFIIFFSNFLGLIPGFIPPTSNLSTTAAMAVIVFVTTHAYGIRANGIGYFKQFFGPIQKWYALPLMLLMFFIEVVSHIARPLSLSIRLMGNMYADHMVVATFVSLIPIAVPVPMMLLGVLVCIVQTAVFCLLATIYIGLAISHAEH
jgi:F-type H+-transporting ATPase subunit a